MSMLLAMTATTSAPDARLVRFAAGDLDAFESLFREFQGAVFRSVVRIVRDADIAEDLTLEVFWRIYKARGRFDPQGSFVAWARRIGTNAALDYVKRTPPALESPRDPGTTPAIATQIDARAKIIAAFDALPPKLRVAAMLAHVEEEPYDEIAALLGISVSAVKSRVFRATQLLRRKLERMGVDR